MLVVSPGSEVAATNVSSVTPPRVRAIPQGNASPRVFGNSPSGDIKISIIIPTYCGGEMIERCLSKLAIQVSEHAFEVLCIDSGSPENELILMQEAGARTFSIEKRFFNHGLTRDLGAGLAEGGVLVFINQDVMPADEHWLKNLTVPLFGDDPPAAVQGAMIDFPGDDSPVRPFYWQTCGPRFYFTREMHRWVSRYPGPSFSTVSAAIRRGVWQEIPFGWAPIMEDKKWQREALESGLLIEDAPDARVFHSHDYTVRSLLRRCQSEGFGWRLLGEHYTFGDMLRDLWAPRVWRDLAGGLKRRRFKMRPAEVVYPWLRPIAVWYGNRRLKAVKH